VTGKSKIQWTDATWNPLAGCSIVSPGCTNCYAMAMAARIERMGGADHYVGLTEMVKGKPVWTGKVALASEKTLLAPLRWKKPRKIFVNSMSDLFHEKVDQLDIASIYGVMIAAHHLHGHIFQWLTKRSARARDVLNREEFWDTANSFAENHIFERVDPNNRRRDDARATCDDYDASNPPPGIWAGVTAEDQPRADERIPDLLATPAAVRFVSCEPMLGKIALHNLPFSQSQAHVNALSGETISCHGDYDNEGPRLDWVIVGGESGPGARPMHPDWARSLRDQCAAAGTPFFFKQWGEWAYVYDRDADDPDWRKPPKAEDNNERYLNLAGGHGFHGERVHFVRKVGKHRAGRLLDGVEHNDFPEAR
jgi:protein gp37